MSEITVSWPSSPLSPKQWTDRLEALAEQAEAMVGKPSSLADQGRLAMAFCGLLWPALSPEVVAGSARASLLLGAPGVVLSSAPADQVQEIAARLDAIWEQAQADPAQAVVTIHPPLMELPPPAAPRIGRPPKAPEAPHPEPAPPEPEPEPVVEVVVEPSPAPEPAPVAPADWLSTGEVCELLEISASTLKNWRKAGRFGQGFGRRGKGYAFDPAAVEAIMNQLIPPALEALMDEIRADRSATE